MTNQEIFDTSVAHLVQQGKRAMRPLDNGDNGLTDQCAYRAADGSKCAVGVLIPDENYTPDIEGMGVATYDVRSCLPFIKELGAIGLLIDLQSLHDGRNDENFFDGFDEKAADIAELYGVVNTNPRLVAA